MQANTEEESPKRNKVYENTRNTKTFKQENKNVIIEIFSST